MTTVSETIKHDHQEIDEYYNNIIAATDNDTKARWQNQFIWELARHAIGEELVIYPAMEKHLPNGKELASKDREMHAHIKQALYKFQLLQPSDPAFEPTLQALMSELSQHIVEEEADDLPGLEKYLDGAESAALAKSFTRTKMFVPTRSHPSAPDKPPFETVVGMMAAPMDKLADLFRKFPQ